MRRVVLCACLVSVTMGISPSLFAQQPAPSTQGSQTPAAPPSPTLAGDVVVGAGNYSPIVQDLDKAIEFYGGLLGLTVPAAPAPGPRPVNTDPALLNMFGVPGGQLRFVTARIPGAPFGVEMVEVRSAADRQAVRPKPEDPGGATLIVLVRDITVAMAPLKKAGVPMVTPGGEPLSFGLNNAARGVIVADPDGHYVELLQPNPLPPTAAPPESNVIGARVRFTVADTEQALKVYRDVLHVPGQVGEFRDMPLSDLMGLKGTQIKLTNLAMPGSTLVVELVELKGVTGAPVRPRLADPGATRLQVRLRDLDATMTALKAAGSTVVSAGGVPATLNGGVRAAIMPDPNGFYFVVMQAPPPRPAQ
jgi:catechol 2,3-dioxygenase-like lactoylglutathione lyase family enzyme